MVNTNEDVLEVSITGIGGLFPQSKNVEELTQKLLDQVDMIEDARWKNGQLDVCDSSGNIPNISSFDASYFGIHRKQASFMDPMQRMVMENTFEALIDAGVNPVNVRGTSMAVIIGSCISENDSLMFESVENGFGVTGQARTMMANRISYWLNVTGPSYSTDSSWLCGIQAIKDGCDAIRSGAVESALVGCCNLSMNIHPTYVYKQLGVTNMSGITKAFDDAADGYTRSDGVCVFYLQRANDAKRCYANVVNCNVEFNGSRSGTFSDVNVNCMSQFITNFYKTANVDPKDVEYVETYGCGIKILDERELEVIDAVFNKDRREPLLIGSVKSNLGHSEAAASMLSIVKVLIAMETGVIPGTLNYETPNKNIPALANGKLEVVSKNRDWIPSLVAVNALGIASSFGHILLKPNTRVKQELKCELPILNLFSTRTEEGMKEIIENVKSIAVMDPEYSRLINDVFGTTIPGHLYRGYVIHGNEITTESTNFIGIKRKIWFAYSGMGSQWKTMGKHLLNIPIFAESIKKCHDVLATKGLDLIRIISEDDPNIFDNILHSFVGIAAIQIGLTDILQKIGIVPDGLIGHSVGELGCAYMDGCLTTEQTILSAYYRGRASQEVDLTCGVMAAVGKGAKEMRSLCPPSIDIACHNGPGSCTLSGPIEEMKQFVNELKGKNVFARLVNVSNIAYHSRYIRPAAPLLLKYLKEIIPHPIARSSKWISTSVVESAWNTDLAKTVSPEYLTNNLLSSVHFEEGSTHIPKNAVVIEIAPHGLLQAILKRSLHHDCTNVPLTKRDSENGALFLCAALGKLFMNGVEMNIAPIYPRVELPVSRGTKSLANLVRWSHDEIWRTGIEEFLTYSNAEQGYPIDLNRNEFRNVIGHKIRNDIVIPITSYLPLVCNILSNIIRVERVVFEDIIVKRYIVVSEKEFVPPICIMVQRGTGSFEISSRYGVILSGRVNAVEPNEGDDMPSPSIDTKQNCYIFSKEDIQKEQEYHGYQFSGVFNSIEQLNMYNEGSTASITWKNDWAGFVNTLLQVVTLHEGEYQNKPVMPSFISRLTINLDQIPNVHQNYDISYNYKTKLLVSPIAQIKDVHFAPYSQDAPPLIIETYKFIEYSKEVQNLQTGMNMCLQIVQQSLKSNDSLYIITEIKDGEMSSLENYIYNYSDHYYASKIQLNTLSGNIPISSLIIIGERHLQNIHELFVETTNFVLVCVPVAQPLSVDATIIYSFQSGKLQYHLLKKICDAKPLIINIKSKCYKGSDLKNTSISWVNQLHGGLNENQKRVYLVANILPENGIEVFLNDVKKLRNGSNIRLLFLLDANLPECTTSAKFYQEMFQKDLPVSVYENGNWGSYFKTPYTKLNTEEAIENNKSLTTKDLKNMFRDYNVQSLGLNTANTIPNDNIDSTDLGPVEFSGYDKSGQRVMGIARANMENLEMTPDPDLVWQIPENWSFNQAATVPYAYTNAYYVLFELAAIEPGESILINNGCSSFGQAIIQIAHRYHCKVITTVGSEVQRGNLLSYMKMLSPNQVLLYTDTTFPNRVLRNTNGLGVNVIINCLPDDGLQSSLRCLSNLGRVIQVELSDSDSTKCIGLNLFLYCVGMHGFIPKNILDKPREIKLKIHAMISKGIKKNFVVPVITKIITHENLDPVLKYLKSEQVIGAAVLPMGDLEQDTYSQIYKSNNFAKHICKKNASYIVFGDATDMLLDTTRWLLANGAKLITVFAAIIKSDSNYIKWRLRSLQTQYNTEIKLIENAEDSIPPPKILREIKTIEAVLLLNRQSQAQTLKYVQQIDAQLRALNSTAHLICFWGSQINMTYQRPDSLPVSNIKWEKSHDFTSAVRILDDILTHPAEITLQTDELTFDNLNNFSLKNFLALLSTSQDSILSTVDVASTTTKLIQLPSNGTRECKELLPTFIVPGLLGQKCKYFKNLLKKLLSPVYIINNGSSDCLEAIATDAAKQIKEKIGGPYNIIGISFGGALALEIVKILEEQGEQAQLYLIDGVPKTLQHIINENGNTDWMETSLLSALLRINSNHDITSLRNIPNWDAKVKNAVQLGKYTNKQSEKIINSLNVIKNKLNQVLNYKPSNQSIIGNTLLLRPQDSSQDFSYSLTNCCKQLTVEIIKGNHFTILESDQLAQYVNKSGITPLLYH